MKKQKPLYLSCSMCSHFDPLRSVCQLNDENRNAESTEFAATCKKEGSFIRYMHVLPDVYNFYSMDQDIPQKWDYDYSSVPKDGDGNYLVVRTYRGLERALPANDTVTLRGDRLTFLGVPRILTYQGQREAIFEIGVELARQEAESQGVELTVLPGEENSQGQERYLRDYYQAKNQSQSRKCAWLSDEPVGEW
jgi:hypothetical protein